MGLLTTDMKRVVEEQRLGFVATVCSDGTPNLSPKGTTAVWDDDHLVFANIRSPATILESGDVYDRALAFYERRGSRLSGIREIVLVRVEAAHPVVSPAYDFGL